MGKFRLGRLPQGVSDKDIAGRIMQRDSEIINSQLLLETFYRRGKKLLQATLSGFGIYRLQKRIVMAR